jgi:hypothetical protein
MIEIGYEEDIGTHSFGRLITVILGEIGASDCFSRLRAAHGFKSSYV